MWILIISGALLATSMASSDVNPTYKRSSYSIPDYKRPEYSQPGYAPPDYKVPEQEIPDYSPPEYKRLEPEDASYFEIPKYQGPNYKDGYKREEYASPSYKDSYAVPSDYVRPKYEDDNKESYRVRSESGYRSSYENDYIHSDHDYPKPGYDEDIKHPGNYPAPKYTPYDNVPFHGSKRRFSRYGSYVRPVGKNGEETSKFTHEGAIMKDDEYDHGDAKNREYETSETYEMEYKKRQPVGENGYRDEVEHRTMKRVYSYDNEASKDGRPGYHGNQYPSNDYHDDKFFGNPRYLKYQYNI